MSQAVCTGFEGTPSARLTTLPVAWLMWCHSEMQDIDFG